MCSCAALAHLISADISLLMAAAREGGRRRRKRMGMGGEGEAVFTVMGSGRCWTMTETKERLERRTSKKPFPFQFSVSPVSSATGSFFLSPSSSLNCCLPNPLFFLSPPCSPCLPPRLPVSPSVSPLCVPAFLMSSCWNSPSASSLLPFFFSSLGAAPRLSSHPSFPPSFSPAFLRHETRARGYFFFFFPHSVFLSFGGGIESSRTK